MPTPTDEVNVNTARCGCDHPPTCVDEVKRILSGGMAELPDSFRNEGHSGLISSSRLANNCTKIGKLLSEITEHERHRGLFGKNQKHELQKVSYDQRPHLGSTGSSSSDQADNVEGQLEARRKPE